mgnify:FL=1
MIVPNPELNIVAGKRLSVKVDGDRILLTPLPDDPVEVFCGNDSFDVLQVVGFPEHAVVVHAQLAFVLPHEIDPAHDIRPGTFGE